MLPLLKAIVREMCYRFFSYAFSFYKTKGYCLWKYKFCRLCLRNPASRCSKLAINWKNDNNVTICRNGVIVNFFNIALFLMSSLVTGLSFMSISSLILKFSKFNFIRDWPEIRKSERPSTEFCPISREWEELGIPNLLVISLMKCY